MANIILSRDQVAIVDDEDFDFLNQFKWYSVKSKTNRYEAVRNGPRNYYKRVKILMHRFIIENYLGRKLSAKEQIDHINGNPLDNRKQNLRIANAEQNQSNRGKQRNNTSGYKGVSWNSRSNKWQAQIGSCGELFYLGVFDNIIDAALAYDKKAIELHQQFANTNFGSGGY